MYNTTKTPVWYGELRTARGNVIVIHDKQFPEAQAGRIYLYNAVRDTIIEYAEEIVSGNLHDLDKARIKAAEDTYGAAWDSARSEFMEKHQGWVEANATKHKPLITKAKAKVKSKKQDETASDSSDNEPGSESLDREFANGWSGGLEE
ncbi:hypothetical protein Sps_02925 [Shewanella psychrophila]|uniref:Uncharacterized protein n=1 Tax=Shewanella psychrophila TaxID=225848 RepID=A0A1S6HRD6_9GAMM|nr:hypothetical protein [Shewanella psychrophila]AQS38072.1 hypothetical protein Sps_02925 [Shewanella psychrophila]